MVMCEDEKKNIVEEEHKKMKREWLTRKWSQVKLEETGKKRKENKMKSAKVNAGIWFDEMVCARIHSEFESVS